MNSPTNYTKLHSAILGFAVGDALGVPVEFLSRKQLEQDPVTDFRSGGSHGQPSGTWSDDSSLTFCLMESLCTGELDYTDLGNRFVNWLNHAYWTAHGHVFDVGHTTAKAIQRIENGVQPTACGGMDVYDNGNGSLMRILPLAFWLQDVEAIERFRSVRDVSAITHAHPRSVLSCIYYVEYAGLLIKGWKKEQAYEALLTTFADQVPEVFHRGETGRLNRLITGDIRQLTRDEISSTGYVISTLEAAMWSFLTTDTYTDAVLKAVNLGEDTDTVAAVTGGLAGLYYGCDEIPVHWLEQLVKKKEVADLCTRMDEQINRKVKS